MQLARNVKFSLSTNFLFNPQVQQSCAKYSEKGERKRKNLFLTLTCISFFLFFLKDLSSQNTDALTSIRLSFQIATDKFVSVTYMMMDAMVPVTDSCAHLSKLCAIGDFFATFPQGAQVNESLNMCETGVFL